MHTHAYTRKADGTCLHTIGEISCSSSSRRHGRVRIRAEHVQAPRMHKRAEHAQT